jgi:hypothetical protein
MSSSVHATAVFRRDTEQLVTGMILSELNGQVITGPGWGKSVMGYRMGLQVFGEAGNLFFECSPTTPPERIEGHEDPVAYFERGELIKVVERTPYDEKVRFCTLDEAWRLNEISFDQLVQAIQRVHGVQPVFFGNSNFVVKSGRTAALLDRFAMNYLPSLVMDETSLHEVVRNRNFKDTDFNLPDAETVDAVRSAPYTDKALDAIDALLASLFELTAGTPFAKQVNPRRVDQWTRLLFRTGTYYAQTNAFEIVPNEAAAMLKFAMPVTSADEYAEWGKIASAVLDRFSVMLENFRAQAYTSFQKVLQQGNANDRVAYMAALGQVSADAMHELEQYGDDPRCKELQSEITQWFSLAAQGKSF